MPSLPPPLPLKALVAPGRHNDGPTLYLIYPAADGNGCDIHEQLPDGNCIVWPVVSLKGVQQAESTIYAWAREQQRI